MPVILGERPRTELHALSERATGEQQRRRQIPFRRASQIGQLQLVNIAVQFALEADIAVARRLAVVRARCELSGIVKACDSARRISRARPT